MAHRLVCDQIHLLYLWLAVLSKIILINQDIYYLCNDVITFSSLVNLSQYTAFQCYREGLAVGTV